MHVLFKSRYRDGDREIRLRRGKIQIQSECAEIFYRRIELRPVTAIPPEFSELLSRND